MGKAAMLAGTGVDGELTFPRTVGNQGCPSRGQLRDIWHTWLQGEAAGVSERSWDTWSWHGVLLPRRKGHACTSGGTKEASA